MREREQTVIKNVLCPPDVRFAREFQGQAEHTVALRAYTMVRPHKTKATQLALDMKAVATQLALDIETVATQLAVDIKTVATHIGSHVRPHQTKAKINRVKKNQNESSNTKEAMIST